MKKISIVTPTYNTGKFIERTILSIKNQNYPNYEQIIVDAGSNDETLSIIERYPELTYIIKEKCNQSEAINIGLKKATGEIIGWLNSDDVYEPETFSKVVAFFEKHPEAELVYSDCIFIDEEDKVLGEWKTAPFNYFRNLNYAQMIPQQTIFFRRTILDKVGYLDEKLNFAMDFDFLVRISKVCKIVYMSHEILARFRLHSSSKTMSQRKKFEPETIMIRKRHGAVVPYPVFKIIHGIIGIFKKRL